MNLKPYNFVEIFLYSNLFLFLDFICLLIDFLIPSIISTAIQACGVFILNLIAISKNDKNSLKISKQITKYLIQIFPFLPTLTLIFIFQVRKHNKSIKRTSIKEN